MLPYPLIVGLDAIARRVANAPGLLVLLDFDGTLAPYVNGSRDAGVPAGVLQSIAGLANQPRTVVGVISGRALADLQPRIALDSLVYAGNHGLEIAGRGLHFEDRAAMRLQPALRNLLREISSGLAYRYGIVVENKGLSGTVHWPHLDDLAFDHAGSVCSAALSRHPDFQLCVGNRSLDILPATGWNKGAAATWIRGELGLQSSIVVYAGDDYSDESAFEALPDEITVKVGEGPTSAAFRAERPEEVWLLLDGLLSSPCGLAHART